MLIIWGKNNIKMHFKFSNFRLFKNDMLMSFNEVGKKVPTFGDASYIANCILQSGVEYDVAELHYNIFKYGIFFSNSSSVFYAIKSKSVYVQKILSLKELPSVHTLFNHLTLYEVQ